jgi:hypothetical protein
MIEAFTNVLQSKARVWQSRAHHRRTGKRSRTPVARSTFWGFLIYVCSLLVALRDQPPCHSHRVIGRLASLPLLTSHDRHSRSAGLHGMQRRRASVGSDAGVVCCTGWLFCVDCVRLLAGLRLVGLLAVLLWFCFCSAASGGVVLLFCLLVVSCRFLSLPPEGLTWHSASIPSTSWTDAHWLSTASATSYLDLVRHLWEEHQITIFILN